MFINNFIMAKLWGDLEVGTLSLIQKAINGTEIEITFFLWNNTNVMFVVELQC